jgi:hypothetical protein
VLSSASAEVGSSPWLRPAIDRAEAKRGELQDQQPAAQQTAEVLALLPRAAELYCEQIEAGLSGDPRAAQKGRMIVRELLDGPVKLMPRDDGTLWAEFALRPAALLASSPAQSIRADASVSSRQKSTTLSRRLRPEPYAARRPSRNGCRGPRPNSRSSWPRKGPSSGRH